MAIEVSKDLQQWPGGAVRISMSATVANDLDTFKKGVAAFAEQVGCPECFSGFDCTFESERDFVIDADLDVTPTEVRTGPSISRGAAEREVTVPLSPSAEFDLKAILDEDRHLRSQPRLPLAAGRTGNVLLGVRHDVRTGDAVHARCHRHRHPAIATSIRRLGRSWASASPSRRRSNRFWIVTPT